MDGLNIVLTFLLLLCRKSQADKYIMSAAKLISPAIESSFAAGFDW